MVAAHRVMRQSFYLTYDAMPQLEELIDELRQVALQPHRIPKP